MTSESDGQAVAALVRAKLGAPRGWVGLSMDYGYHDSLALCVIDSVFSLRAKYGSVIAVIGRYCRARVEEGGNPGLDGAAELIAAVRAHGGAALFRNRAVAPGTLERKYDVVVKAAQRLLDTGAGTADEFRSALSYPLRAERVHRDWCGVRGLGPASWHYLRMLAGEEDVKSDVWIGRFVSTAVGSMVPQARAREAVAAAAGILGVGQTELDHTIWLAARAGKA